MTMETTTSQYEIKTYSEDVLDAQYEIGSKEQANRRGWQMTPIESLKQTYSGENFDPTTKFYAYKDNEMVGYVTATIQPPSDDGEAIARLEFPIVLAEHPSAKDQLMNHALDNLKNRGINKIQSRVSEFWPGSREFSEKYGFSYQSDISRRGILEIKDHPTDLLF